jgi:hypothetical protein
VPFVCREVDTFRRGQNPPPVGLGEDVLANITRNVGGDAPVDDRPKVDVLPSPVDLVAFLVHRVNEKEARAPEHVLSLSEHAANKLLKDGMMDLVKHTQCYIDRVYPKGF